MQENTKRPILYSVLTLFVTGLVGQILLWAFPNGAGIGASLLFILMNLIPMLAAIGFSLKTAECKTILVFFETGFCPAGDDNRISAGPGRSGALLRGIRPAPECDLHRSFRCGRIGVFSLDAFAGRIGRSGLAVVSPKTPPC